MSDTQLKHRDLLIVKLVKQCGLKSGQINGLRVRDWDGDTLICRSSKAHGLFAKLMIPEKIGHLLSLCCIGLSNEDPIIQNYRGEPLATRGIQRVLSQSESPLDSGHYSKGKELFETLVVECFGSRDPVDIYLIMATDHLSNKTLKIGSSINPEKRLSQLKSSRCDRDEELEIVSVLKGLGRSAELELQRKFWGHHIGGEWFHFNQEIVDAFWDYPI